MRWGKNLRRSGVGGLLQGPGTAGTESRFLQEPGGQVSLSTAPSLSFPIQANRLPHRFTYKAHLKTRLKVQVPRGQRPFSLQPTHRPGPGHVLHILEQVSTLWGPAGLGRMAWPEFSRLGISHSQKTPSDSDAPQGAGFFHACQQHLQSGLPRGCAKVGHAPRGGLASSKWESQGDLGSNSQEGSGLPLPLSDLGEVTASGLPMMPLRGQVGEILAAL